MSKMDVAVLGGGPAGLAAALALRQRGCNVALYDAQRPPIDKACGEGLMPKSVRLLEGLGVALDRGDGVELAGISFHDASCAAHGAFSSGGGLGARRTRLHSRMAARAAEMGVVLRWGTSVRALAEGGFAAAGSPITAEFFVIADGLCSTLAAAAGFREQRCYSTRYASRQPFRCRPWNDTVEVHWGCREQLYVTPVGENEVNIALLTSHHGRRVCDALPDFPEVARRLVNAAATSTARGSVTRTRTLRQVVRGNVAVLGDASGSVDAITGEGLLSAFRQAQALADALAAGKPGRYAAAHRQIAKNPRRMARLLLLLDRHPRLQRHFIAALARQPKNFAALLRVHLGEQSWPAFAAHAAAGMLAGSFSSDHKAHPRVHPWYASAAASGRRERGI
ncbi:MAG: FAD-dependent monooxygenase [Acidobacteriaceae bacterium]